jgi:hypothetical protein
MVGRAVFRDHHPLDQRATIQISPR